MHFCFSDSSSCDEEEKKRLITALLALLSQGSDEVRTNFMYLCKVYLKEKGRGNQTGWGLIHQTF